MKPVLMVSIVFAVALLVVIQNRSFIQSNFFQIDSIIGSDSVDGPTICTYFVPLRISPEEKEENKDMLNMWKESWMFQGWNTRVLIEQHAKMHPRYQEMKNAIAKLPTVFPETFAAACYLRWAAAIASGCNVSFNLGKLKSGRAV
jgi:hypothetical protein